MRIVELIIDEKDEQSGIDAISVVMSPAIEENFIHLSKHEILLKEVDAEKRILMGPALVPDKQIYRKNDKTKDEYYIYFSKATIRKASELFLMNANQNNSTLEHSQKLKGMSVVESWIIEGENDKSKNYGFDLPKGTWMISMKVNNDEIWNKVKLGEVKGFSIEGYFADRYEMNSKNIDMEEKAMVEKIKELIIKSELKSNKVDLSLIDDFTKLANTTITNGDLLKKEIVETQKDLNTYFKLKSDLENQKKSLEIEIETAQRRIERIIDGRNTTSKIYQDLVSKASDLGINYPKSIDTIMKEIDNLVQYTKSVLPKNVKL
jgi:hypothetical protein